MLIQIDYQDKRPIYEQVVEKMQNLIVRGILSMDEKIPSVRSLAIELSINPNTIQKAYTELERQGFIYTIKGRGNFVRYDKSLLEVKKEELRGKVEEVLKEADELGISRKELLEGVEI